MWIWVVRHARYWRGGKCKRPQLAVAPVRIPAVVRTPPNFATLPHIVLRMQVWGVHVAHECG
jgi:hypothetical protein